MSAIQSDFYVGCVVKGKIGQWGKNATNKHRTVCLIIVSLNTNKHVKKHVYDAQITKLTQNILIFATSQSLQA